MLKIRSYPFFSIPQSTKGKIFDQLPLSAQTAVMRAINARKNPTVEIPTDTLLLDIFTEDEVGRLLTVNESVKRSTQSFLAFEESVKNYMAAPPLL